MFVRQIGRAIFALVLIGTAIVVTQSPANAATQGPFKIQGYHALKCIEVPGSNPNNVVVVIYTCRPGSAVNQKWYFDDTTNGYKRIRSILPGNKCLTVLNASKEAYARVIVYPCVGGANAEWKPRQVREGESDYYLLENRNSGMCLTVLNASRADLAELIQYPCVEAGQGNNFWTWWY